MDKDLGERLSRVTKREFNERRVGKVVAYPYHKRIHLGLSDADLKAIKAKAYEGLRKAVLAGKIPSMEDFEYVTTEPLRLSADQCSAEFDVEGSKESLFMDVNWELIDDEVSAGQKLVIREIGILENVDKEVVDKFKEYESFEDFDEWFTGTVRPEFMVDADAAMQYFYAEGDGKEMLLSYLKEEEDIEPSVLEVKWDAEATHLYQLEK